MTSKHKGFTMIELLAAIVILGVLSIFAITSATRFISKAKGENVDQQRNALIQAAQSYMQANRSKLPKTIGEEQKVTAITLKEKRYLQKDLKNKEDEDCMPKTYVKVKRTSKAKYEYSAVVLCGNDQDTNTSAPKPAISLYFSDATGNKLEDDASILKHVKEATLYMEFKGEGKEPEEIAETIDGYSYAIYVKGTGDTNFREVFNTGTLSGNGKKVINVKRKVTDFIDITDITDFNVKATVRNKSGGYTELNTSDTYAKFHDTDKPICVDIEGQAEANNWINKESGGSTRTIKAGCEDGKGSGCIRPTFTRTWPNDEQIAAEWAYIQVEDNATNKNLEGDLITAPNLCKVSSVSDSCRVRVNVDKVAPTIEVLGSYKATASRGKEGANTYTGHTKVTDNPNSNLGMTGSVGAGDYNNLVGGWMNKANYLNGVVYEIKISDNIHLASWKWETNESYLNYTKTDTVKNTYNSKNDGSKSETITSPSGGNCGTLEKTIIIGFKEEGERRGKLTVYDKAGNKTYLTISANIDVTPPPVPSGITYSNGYNPNATGAALWTNKIITVTVPDGMRRDNTSGPNKIELSRWNKFNYHVTKDYDTSHPLNGVDYKFVFNSTYQGKNNIEFNSCDNAGNCSNYSGLKKVWVDFTKPVCKVTLTNNGVNSKGWLGIGESATVKAQCIEDASTNRESGCDNVSPWKATFSKTYNSNMNVTNAGAVDVGNGGKVRDIAKNERDCAKNFTVKIDHNAPTCLTTGETTKNSKGNWIWRQTGTTITRECRDTGGSGCEKKVYKSQTYNTSGHTYKTEDYKAYTISDNADNKVTCPAKTIHIYVDKQKPSCSGDKSHQNTTDGVTIKYSCSDHGGSGVANCPSNESKVKKDRSYTVKDNVGNKMTCSVNVTAYNQYRYIKKNVPKTCTNACCGTKTCTSGSCCGWNKHTGQNCRNCGSSTACTTSYKTSSGSGCPSGWTYNGCAEMHTNGCGRASCKKKKCVTTCKTCTWNTTAKRCTKACCGYYTCTSGRCCGYACGSQWTSWGASKTGCKSDSRKLYK